MNTWSSSVPMDTGRASRPPSSAAPAGINVPEEVAVLGVDNTDTICDCLCVPLSSIDSNLEQVGYEGAALLDQLMSLRAAAAKHIEVAPAGIVERRSTDAYAVEQPRVRQAFRVVKMTIGLWEMTIPSLRSMWYKPGWPVFTNGSGRSHRP
jgi:hypothetical protein